MPEIRDSAGVFVDPNEYLVACNATVFKPGNYNVAQKQKGKTDKTLPLGRS